MDRLTVKVLNLKETMKKLGNIKNIDVTPVIQYGAIIVQRRAKELVPFKTGILRESIFQEVHSIGKNNVWGEVYTDTEYAPYVEYGIFESYVIVPKNKKALYWKGAKHPVKRVVIPPRAGHPFMLPALEQGTPSIVKFAEEYIAQQLSKINKSAL